MFIEEDVVVDDIIWHREEEFSCYSYHQTSLGVTEVVLFLAMWCMMMLC